MSAARSWMLFVDGENFTIQAEKLAAHRPVTLTPCDWYRPGVYLWPPGAPATFALVNFGLARMPLERHAMRAHFYTSVVGSDEDLNGVRKALRTMGFTPHVFKKDKSTQKTKGVDIAFATDVLSNAYLNNYEAAVLVAGDGDYLPLVEEIKHAGKLALLWFFDDASLSPQLRLACDAFEPQERYFDRVWSAATPSAASDGGT